MELQLVQEEVERVRPEGGVRRHEALRPVSYTHLDVYKRQLEHVAEVDPLLGGDLVADGLLQAVLAVREREPREDAADHRQKMCIRDRYGTIPAASPKQARTSESTMRALSGRMK